MTLKEGCGVTFKVVIMEEQSKVDGKYRETRGEILVGVSEQKSMEGNQKSHKLGCWMDHPSKH